MLVRLQKLQVKFACQGHRVKVKVKKAKTAQAEYTFAGRPTC